MRIVISRERGPRFHGSARTSALVALTLVLAGCSGSKDSQTAPTPAKKIISSQEEGVANVPPDVLNMGHFNHHLHITGLTLLGTGNHRVAAIKLFDISALQANLPVLIHVTGAFRKLIYSNGGAGVDPTTQHIGLLRPGHDAWWVDDQISIETGAGGFTVKVGTSTSPIPHPLPDIATVGTKLAYQGTAGTVSGTLVNHSPKVERDVVISAVALAGKRVVGAGRAVVRTLPASPARAPFRISLISDGLKGDHVELSVIPLAG